MDVTNNVLIVDDEKMIRDAVSAYFTRMGWRTFEADNGQDALALFEKKPFSVKQLYARMEAVMRRASDERKASVGCRRSRYGALP